ncbi:transposase [Streptomyces flavochromogenes]|uniref:Transposase n=1 Tax=Streptomyces flavochromogenes TaxID=68199 RepID=A0ABW6XZ61_9ACTN
MPVPTWPPAVTSLMSSVPSPANVEVTISPTGWPAPSAKGPQPVEGFAAFLQNDWDAVVNGLTLHWSSGAVEGQVTRIKLIKRRSYGHASFALLRTLVLAQPP